MKDIHMIFLFILMVSDTNKNNLLVEEIENSISSEKVEKEVAYSYLNFAGIKIKINLLQNRDSNSVVVNNINNLIFITLEDYNK